MTEQPIADSNSTRQKRGAWTCLTFSILIPLMLIGGAYAYYRHQYPYGWTHVCDKQLYFALRNWAEDHDGAFPTGAPNPEACLSLLHGEPYSLNTHVLSGKSIETHIAEEALANDGVLGPDSCGWHYVPGLTVNDDPRLALFWDKTGLGHNGGRLDGGGYVVFFIEGNRRHITASEWDSFLVAQEELRRSHQRPAE